MLICNQLQSLLKSAQQEVLIVSPFMKNGALKELLDVIPDGIKIQCVTRWHAKEILDGVSDLSVLDLISARVGAKLFLRQDLHAKYFKADQQCLVGSANVTGKALGLSSRSNLELLVACTQKQHEIQSFERILFDYTISATEEIRKSILDQVEELKLEYPAEKLTPLTSLIEQDFWLPTCPKPEKLFNVYSEPDKEISRLTTSAFEAAKKDLKLIGVPKGLARNAFHEYIRCELKSFSLIQALDQKIKTGLTDDIAINLLREEAQRHTLIYSPEEMWGILKDWLMYFFPDQYRARPSGEELISGSLIR
jgi:phosphatidylserine/phosphatidylglycerophosphate/cardiolipin synthase-like enzyme